MSEFSDSYHLLTSIPQDVDQLIRRVRRFGFVMPTQNRFIPFLIEGLGDVGGPADAVIECNESFLLHYAYAEDSGCCIRIFDNTIEVATLNFPSDQMEVPHPAQQAHLPSLEALRDRGIINSSTHAALQRLTLSPLEDELGSKVASAFGLERVQWLSCADLTYQTDKALRARFAGSHFVNKAQKGKAVGRTFEELMALQLPVVLLDQGQEAMALRHYRYWTEFGDYEEDLQEGFWMYNFYKSLLPTRYRYLPDQLMNLTEGGSRTLATIRAIMGLAGSNVDWAPLLRDY